MGRWSGHVMRDLAIGPLDLKIPANLSLLCASGDAIQDCKHSSVLSQIATTATKLTQLFDQEFVVGFTTNAVPYAWQHVRSKYMRSPENGFRRGCVQLAEHARNLPDNSPLREIMTDFANATLAAHYVHRAARFHMDEGEDAVQDFIQEEYRAHRLYNGAAERLYALYPRQEGPLETLRKTYNAQWFNRENGGLRHLLETQEHALTGMHPHMQKA